jgi:hypothetical protein
MPRPATEAARLGSMILGRRYTRFEDKIVTMLSPNANPANFSFQAESESERPRAAHEPQLQAKPLARSS